jgi:DNA-binding MarR family transcriptional regulator
MLPESLHHQPDAQPEGAQDPAAPEVLEALVTTTHAVYRFAHARIAHVQLPAKLSGPRLRVLFAVKEAGSLRMGDLAAQLGVAARTVTDLVDGLEKAGLLTRRPDPRDRRATLLELSPSARERWEQVRTLRREICDEVLAPLDAAERRQLLALLQRLKEGPLREAAVRPWWSDEERHASPGGRGRRHPPAP